MRNAWKIAAGCLALPALALAQSLPSDQPADAPAAVSQPTTVRAQVALPETDIVGTSPLVGSGLSRDKVAAGVSTVTGKEVVRTGVADALGTLDQATPGATLNSSTGNGFQPDLVYRGFTASPSDGADQGLAVYVNGARFNQPFGDTVLWDLIPAIAIDKMDIQGANPVFGLNALGGSLNVKLKNGFTYHGAELTGYGGSFGRAAMSFQYGQESGDTSTYVATNVLHEGGWRQDTASDLRQIYGDLGWRGNAGEAHLSIIGAQNDLNGPGTSPVGLLASDRAAQFTGPNAVHNKYGQVNLNVSYDVNDDLSLQALVYYTRLSQIVSNGNTPNYQPCNAGGGLCEQDGVTPLTTVGGAQIPDYLNGGPYSQLAYTDTESNGYGGSVQLSDDADRFGFGNKLVAGMSFDGAITNFSANSYTGALTASRGFSGPGYAIDQADGSIAPVKLLSTNAYYGAYVSDVFDITKALSMTVSGRFNVAQIQMDDRIGTALNGNHYYQRFNPGVGLTYKVTPQISAFASYAEANRAPTPAELSCASINSPCTLANFFVGDPNLKQVVARTLEAGMRGTVSPFDGATLKWDIDLYRTETQDDILFAPSTIVGRDFFQNIGRTQRQGIDAALALHRGSVTLTLNYGLTDATFQSPITLDSGSLNNTLPNGQMYLNPGADANGQIHVKPGDRMPGIPLQQIKIGADWQIDPQWSVGARATASTGEVLFGDEANLTPSTGAYFVLNANASYKVTQHLELFAVVQNILNAKYATYGTFSDPTSIPCPQCGTSTTALSPAPPISAYGGVRVTF